ncbi:MAG: GAF domain-containing protein [Anaerolineae bacterium]
MSSPLNAPRLAVLVDLGERLAGASSADQVWLTVLDAVVPAVAEAGAWVWPAPKPRVCHVGSVPGLSDSVAWQEALQAAGSPSEPVRVEGTSASDVCRRLLIVPVGPERPPGTDAWPGWFVLGGSPSRDGFDEADLELAVALEEMATVVASTLQRQTRSEARDKPGDSAGAIDALRRVTHEIASTLDLDRVLRVVLDEALGFAAAEAGFVVLFAADRAELAVAKGVPKRAALQARIEGPDVDRALLRRLRTEEQVHLSDSPAQAFGLPDARSVLVTPVFYEQRLAGAILIQSAEPGGFPSGTVSFVRAVAEQAAIAIGGARRYEEQVARGELMRQRAEQLALLLEISRTMRSERPLEDVLLDVAYAVQEGTGFDLVLISVLEGATLRRVAGAGIPLAELERMKGVRLRWDRVQRLCQERFRVGQCYYVPARFQGEREGLDIFVSDESGAEAPSGTWHEEDLFFVPLRGSGGEVLGILSVDRPRDGLAPTAMTAEVVELFAAQVAQLLETAQLVDDLRRQVTALELLNELSRSIATRLDLPLVLNTVVQAVTTLLGYDFATVFLRDDAEGRFVPRASSGYPLKALREDATMAYIADVVRSGMPLVVEDAEGDPRFSEVGLPIAASMAVPLVAEGRTVGVLTADRKVGRDEASDEGPPGAGSVGGFSPAEVATLTAVADQVAVAVENARLFEEVRRFNEELEARVAARTRELGAMLRVQQVEAAKHEAVLESIADGVMVADATGRVILFNAAAERILSLEREQVLGRQLEEILGSYREEAHEWLSQVAAWQKDPEAYGPEGFVSQRLEVGRRFVSLHLSPVAARASAGSPGGVVVVFRDITPEIEADRAKSDFVSTVSHELRTPMTSIVGYVDLLLQGAVGALSESQLQFLERVRSSAGRLMSLVDDLLDISRLEQGRVELLRRPVVVAEVVEQVVELLRPKIAEKEQRLEMVVPAGLPRVYADSDRLAQVLTNLVSNAHKYTPAGGRVAVHAYVREGMMHVAVADTGIGIAPENQERIFERFYRVEDDPAVYETSGTGLGLAIALSLIQMHEGQIWLESELGVGSIFTFSLPLAEGEPTEDVGDRPVIGGRELKAAS